MTTEDRQHGWWGVPAAATWKCPECGVASPVEDWDEVDEPCESCGGHDGRRCPKCGECFDHVFSVEQLIEANR